MKNRSQSKSRFEWMRNVLALLGVFSKMKGIHLRVSLPSMISISLVMFILLFFLSASTGLRSTLASDASGHVGVVVRIGSDTEAASSISRDDVDAIAALNFSRIHKGNPIVAPEFYSIAKIRLAGSSKSVSVPFRGISETSLAARSDLKLVSGRWPRVGADEVVLGRLLSESIDSGDEGVLDIGNTNWRVVGVFDAGLDVFESEMWADINSLRALYQRGLTYQSVWVALREGVSIADFSKTIADDPKLALSVKRPEELYETQIGDTARIAEMLGRPLALIMAFGAAFALLGSTSTTISYRQNELRLLNALGFTRAELWSSIVCETIVLSIVSAVFAFSFAFVFLDGAIASTSGSGFLEVSFVFQVTLIHCLEVLVASIVIAIFGSSISLYYAE